MASRHTGRKTLRSISKPIAIENLETRRLYDGLGINANQVNATNYGPMVQMLRESGTTDVRLWYGFSTYQERSLANIARYVQKFHNDGFNVTMVVSPREGRHGTYDETQGFFQYLVDQPELKNSVDHWELGNEPGSEHYWRGTVADFTTDFLIPAAKVLQAAGESVISGAPAWNPEEVQTMVDNGMLRYVDYVGFHPYAHNIGQLKSRIARLKEIAQGKPLAGTEWNMRGHEKESDKQAWASDVENMAPVIRQNFAISHYFAATVQDSMAGPGGVITQVTGKPNRPFYNSWFAISNSAQVTSPPPDNGGGSDDGGDNGGDDGGDNGGDDGGDDNGNTDGGGDTATDGETDNSGTSGGTKDGGGKTTHGKPKPRPTTDKDDDASDGTGVGAEPDAPAPTPPAPSRPPVIVIPPALSSLSLINADRDRVLQPYAVLSGVVTVDLASTGTPNLTVLASANKKAVSVKFTLNGSSFIDNDGTFTLFGEKNGDLNGEQFTPGKVYALTAQAFSGANATGDSSEIQTVLINVINTKAADDYSRTPANAATIAAARRRANAGATNGGGSPTILPGL